MEPCQVALGPSQSVSLTYPHKVVVVKIKGGAMWTAALSPIRRQAGYKWHNRDCKGYYRRYNFWKCHKTCCHFVPVKEFLGAESMNLFFIFFFTVVKMKWNYLIILSMILPQWDSQSKGLHGESFGSHHICNSYTLETWQYIVLHELA